MNAWTIGLLAWYGLGALLVVAMIGKQRKPITPAQAVVFLLIYAVLAFCVVQS